MPDSCSLARRPLEAKSRTGATFFDTPSFRTLSFSGLEDFVAEGGVVTVRFAWLFSFSSRRFPRLSGVRAVGGVATGVVPMVLGGEGAGG